MTRVDISDYLELKQMPSGRHVFALTSMRAVAVQKLGEATSLLPVFDDALVRGREALKVELAWEVAKKVKSDKARGGAFAVKQRITRCLSNLYAIVQGRTDGDDEVAVKARELVAASFPNGVAAISNQTFEVMLGMVETMLTEQLQGALAGHVATVGVGREVGLLAELTVRFAQELRPQQRGQVTHDIVEKAQHALHEATSEVLTEILHATSKRNFTPPPGSEPMTDLDRVRIREEILAPLNFQQELVSEAYSRHKLPLDVDPDTGEEIDPDANNDVNDDPNDDVTGDVNGDVNEDPTGA